MLKILGKKKTANNDFIDGLVCWRIKNVGPFKDFESKTYYWCPHHVKEGKWNRMYVLHLHRPDQHKGKRMKTDAAPIVAPAKDSLQQDEKGGGIAAALQFQSRLKTVMCANFCLSSEDVDKIFDEAKN